MTKNRVIGKDNDLPWYLPDDFRFFKEKTKNHYVIMGRKNYESLPHKFKPLPDRTNLVLTRNDGFEANGTTVLKSLEEALLLAEKDGEQEAFIIGGGQIYQLGLDHADTIYLTEINAEIKGDTYFPKFDKNEWTETERIHHPADEKHAFSFDFVTYKKRLTRP